VSCLDDFAIAALTRRGWAKGALVLAEAKGIAAAVAIGVGASMLWRRIEQRRLRPPHSSA